MPSASSSKRARPSTPPSSKRQPNSIPVVLASLRSRRFLGFDTERAHLTDLITRTIVSGESNSVLVMGARGAGKSALVDAAVTSALEGATGAKSQWTKNDVLRVRLNGLLCVDDRLALKEITRQLNLENVVGDKVFGSFSDHLDFLLASLRTGDKRSSKPVIFVLDEFDLFCEHHNQTLLYNLFDTAQTKAVPMIIVGLTTRIDVVELMEKRVKSRFCHRSIHLNKITDAGDFRGFAVKFLRSEQSSTTWNKHVERVVTSVAGRRVLDEIFDYTASLAHLKRVLEAALMKLATDQDEEDDEALTPELIKEAYLSLHPDYDRRILEGLSVLDLTLIAAANHVRAKSLEESPFNFEMVLAEYKKFVNRKCSMLNFDRSVIVKSWETLIYLEIVRPTDRGAKIQNEYKDYVLEVRSRDICEVIEAMAGIPLDLKEWAKSGINGGV